MRVRQAATILLRTPLSPKALQKFSLKCFLTLGKSVGGSPPYRERDFAFLPSARGRPDDEKSESKVSFTLFSCGLSHTLAAQKKFRCTRLKYHQIPFSWTFLSRLLGTKL